MGKVLKKMINDSKTEVRNRFSIRLLTLECAIL
jgi:hypothetical protein